MSNGQRAEETALIAVNNELQKAENAGNTQALGQIVASALAFRRRNGTIVDRNGFLQSPRPGNRVTSIESVKIYGDRAVVTCIVTEGSDRTHNIRLFVKVSEQWQLLGWANEPA